MAEKRKPSYIWMLSTTATNRKTKIELFDSKLWGVKGKKYRIRHDGRWINNSDGEKLFVNKWVFRDILFRSIKF